MKNSNTKKLVKSIPLFNKSVPFKFHFDHNTIQNNPFNYADNVEKTAFCPPYTNRGGLTSLPFSFPDKTIRCEYEFNATLPAPPTRIPSAIVDYLSFTFKLGGFDCSKMLENFDWRRASPFYRTEPFERTTMCTRDEQEKRDAWIKENPNWLDSWSPTTDEFIADDHEEIGAFCGFLRTIISDCDFFHTQNGMFGYKKTIVIMRGEFRGGIIAYEGNADTCLVSLTGYGCSGLDMSKFRQLLEHLPAGKITRVDLAHDDLEGRIPLRRYRQMYTAGLFRSGSIDPTSKFIENSDNSGNTFQVGKKANGKEACIYEKGKQQGDKNSPWVRVEGRITAVDRVIPFEVLTSPGLYLSGLYPCFRHLHAFTERILVIKKQVAITLEKYLGYARNSYGQGIQMLKDLGWSDEKIIEQLSRDGLPKRFKSVPYNFDLTPMVEPTYEQWLANQSGFAF